MSDDLNHKVIHLFQRHKKGEVAQAELEAEGEMIETPDGFHYVTLKHENIGLHEEQSLISVAEAKHYVVKMMEVHHDNNTVRLSHYIVPGNRLEEFLASVSERPGRLLEIRQFIPETTA